MQRILALVLLAAVSAPGRVGAQATVTTQASSPALTALADSMAHGDFGYVDALHVVRNGVPVLSRAFPRSYVGVYPMTTPPGAYNYQDPEWHPFYQGRTLHTLQSVTKSIVSLVYGVAIARKDIVTIDQPIAFARRIESAMAGMP